MVALNYYQGMDRELTKEQLSETKEMRQPVVDKKQADDLVSLLDKMPVGVIHFEPSTGHIVWYNPYAELVFSNEDGFFNAELVKQVLAEQNDGNKNHRLFIDDRKYTSYLDDASGMFYFFDAAVETTDSLSNLDMKPVIGVISIDNYDDALDGRSDLDVTSLNSIIVSAISNFTKRYHIFYRRIDTDRFYFFTNYAVLKKLIEQKFPVLEEFKRITQENQLPLTLSMGISYGESHFDNIGQVALQNLNFALVRGGDQAIVKEDVEFAEAQYFGGGSASTIKRSRTRTRAMMTAISDKIRSSDRVFVVGHRNIDMDALGASVGMQLFASNVIDNAYVVYDDSQMNPDIVRAMLRLREDGKTQMLTLGQASLEITPNSLLIMVDHSKISLTLSKEFYQRFSEVVVIDHHRRDEDFPDNAAISFIESGASSASELVTELLQFQNGSNSLSRMQASILMAGMMLDTKNFTSSVTSRTFDVASYLRSKGSDSTIIQRILAVDYEEYRQVNELILAGKKVLPDVVVAAGAQGVVYSNVLASKAADTILAMNGISATFVVVCLPDGRVAVSARSQGDINVQRIMERMGGGGHFNLAACQVTGKTVAEVSTELIALIKENLITEEGNNE
ncbi:Phosphoesterase, DHH family protein [Streptococcus sp. DD12]|nr:Phosphoesterase, DHH family protein [Streptococcus sp. DD12]